MTVPLRFGRAYPLRSPPMKYPSIFSVLVLLTGISSTVMAVEPAFVVPVGQRQLFLDDHGIAEIRDLKRTVHQPEKRGAVVRSANPSQTIQTRTSPVWDPAEKVFKLWVMSTDQPLRLSTDGLHWVAGAGPNLRIDHAVYDPRDADPARRFKASLLNEGFAVSQTACGGRSWMCPPSRVRTKATSVTIH